MSTPKPKTTGLARLREPFDANQINQLPKPYKAESAKGRCNECGGYHGLPAAHLDYVGHAALTDRLLDADPEWTYELVVTDPVTGAPIFDANGGLWIRLTVCGVTRLGYGDAQGKKGGNAIKEAIGDALRNAGMRFGAALDLWHKGDLHDADVERGTAAPVTAQHAKPADLVPVAVEAILGAKDAVDLDRLEDLAKTRGIAGVADVKAALEAARARVGASTTDHWAVATIPDAKP